MAATPTRHREPRGPSVTEEAIRRIRERIISGNWGPGDRLIHEGIIGGDPELARAAATAHIASGERWLPSRVDRSSSCA